MIALWASAVVVGLALAVFASHQTLDSARSLAERLGLSTFVIGLTVVAIGTDLPEIANGIMASATGHGDIVTGDALGSAVTQVTLIMAILCLIRPLVADRGLVAASGLVTVLALLVAAALTADSQLSRTDGAVLVAFWSAGALAIHRTGYVHTSRQQKLFGRGTWTDLRGLVVGLAGVGAGATLAVTGFAEVADRLGLPEFAISFLLLSLGTSLPELVVDAAAIRQGQTSLALGDLIGSSFVDASLALGIGPLLFPISVSGSASSAALVSALAVAAAVAILMARRKHAKGTAALLATVYAASYLAILA